MTYKARSCTFTMRPRVFLLLLLLSSPALACLTIDIPGKEYQGTLPFNFYIGTDLKDDTAYLDTVELIFDQPVNLTSIGTGFCIEEVGDLCRRVTWKYTNTPLVNKTSQAFTLIPDFCLTNGTYLNVDIIANGRCPVNRYEYRLYSDAFAANQADRIVCGPFHSVEATLVNVSIYSYYKPLGGNATLYVSGAGHDEVVAYYDERCKPLACGTYEWVTNKTSMGFGFRACANVTFSEVIVGQGQESIRAWWKFTNYTKTTEHISKSIRVHGKPVVHTIEMIPESILEQQTMLFKAGILATCGDIDTLQVQLNGTNLTCEFSKIVKEDVATSNVTYNQTCEVFKVTSGNATLTLNNTQAKWAEFSVYTVRTGDTTMNLTTGYKNYSVYYNTTNITVGYNPQRCDDGYQRCGGVCQETPNCTRPCSLGVVCRNDNLQCMYRECGVPCPNQPGKYCDGQGYCLPPQFQGYPCECKEMCLTSYLEGDTCLHSVTCEGTCKYITRTCNGVCTSWGCCGDGFCDAGENCEACPSDCGCDDKNACTTDTCTWGKCTHENYPCGTTCSEGLCDGSGLCRSDACCADSDCSLHQCKTGTCSNFTCAFETFTCTNCTGGWCLDGNCMPFLELGERCDCNMSCDPNYACSGGWCSLCGNDQCDLNECFTCWGDCDLQICAEDLWASHGIQIIIGVGLLISMYWSLKGLIPQVQEMLRKSKQLPPEQY